MIHVVVALITRPLTYDDDADLCKWASEHEYFIAVRPDGPWAGQWEFPGGKVESGETLYEALVREVQEETGITVHSGRPYMVINSESVKDSSSHCRLHVWEVTQWSGHAHGAEGQRTQWSRLTWQDQDKFLKPNRHMLTAMRLTRCLLIFNMNEASEMTQLLSHAHIWESLNSQLGGSLTVRLRANGLAAQAYYTMVEALQVQIQAGFVRYIVDVLPFHKFSQTHIWSQKNILAAYFPSWWQGADYRQPLQELKSLLHTQYPELLRGASCHSIAELEWACHTKGVDAHFYCLSPVLATSSHPEVYKPLGWRQWSIMNQLQQPPGYALGGLSMIDLLAVTNAGGFGIAGISCFQKETVSSEWQNIQEQMEVPIAHDGEFH